MANQEEIYDFNKVVSAINNFQLCHYHNNYYNNLNNVGKVCDNSYKYILKVVNKYFEDNKKNKDEAKNSELLEKICIKIFNLYKNKPHDSQWCINNQNLITILDKLYFNSDKTQLNTMIKFILSIKLDITKNILIKIGKIDDLHIDYQSNIKYFDSETLNYFLTTNNQKIVINKDLLKIIFENKKQQNHILQNLNNIVSNKIDITPEELDNIVKPYICKYGYTRPILDEYLLNSDIEINRHNRVFLKLVQCIDPKCYQSLFNNFASYLAFDAIKFLINDKISPDTNTLKSIIKYTFHESNIGSFNYRHPSISKMFSDLIYYLLENNTPITYDGFKTCIIVDYVVSKDYLEMNNIDINSEEIAKFAKQYYILSNLTKYKDYKPDYVTILDEMIKSGQTLTTIKAFVKEKKIKPSQKSIQLACNRSSSIPLINFLIEKGCKVDIDCLSIVINSITNRTCKHVSNLFIEEYKKKNNITTPNPEIIKDIKNVDLDDSDEDEIAELEKKQSHVKIDNVDFETKARKKYLIGKKLIDKINEIANEDYDENDKFTEIQIHNYIKRILENDTNWTYIDGKHIRVYQIKKTTQELFSFLNNNTIKENYVMQIADLGLLIKNVIYHFNK